MEKTIELPELTPEQRQEIMRQYFREGGLKGGATIKKRGRAYFQEIGRKGAQTRWAKNKEANKE